MAREPRRVDVHKAYFPPGVRWRFAGSFYCVFFIHLHLDCVSEYMICACAFVMPTDDAL